MAELTTNFFINQANAFIADVQDTRNAYYIFGGKSQPWPNDSQPTPTADSIEQTQLSVYGDLLFGKLISNTDVSPLIPRYNWTSNTVYVAYDQSDADLFSKQFYVMNDQFQVYKCIFNNRGANSTVQPRLTSTIGTFNTSDGYVWKYMYTVDSQANTKFTSSDYIPVSTNNAVSGNAVSGSIDAFKISNGGSGYAVYESGFIFRLIDKFTIQLPSTSSSNNDYYTRSSIYLKSGFGSGQIREISSYNGATKQLRVATSTPFETFLRLDFTAQPNGTVTTGYFAEQQYDRISYLFISNNQAFTVGSNVIQSDTVATGTVLSVNSSVIRVTSDTTSAFALTLPIRDSSQDGTVRTGTVTITSGSNTVTGVNTTFTNTTTGYTVGSYIRVGANTNSQIRRVSNITNNTVLGVSSPFTSSLVANSHFFVPIAAEPSSITVSRANGTISNTNLSSLKLEISNSTLAGVNFIVGEQVTQVDVANTYLGANAIVAFANSTTMFLGGVTGSWTTSQFVLGGSSLQKSQIQIITNNPNVTLRDPAGEFILGFPVNFRLNSLSPSISGNAVLAATTTLPNDQTEYQIAPTVLVTGDGSNSRAIAVVNTANGSSRDIIAIDVIDPGSNYTMANVQIYANNSFGSGATATAIIAPIVGHGKNAVYELGGRYVGVSTTFDTGTSEGFFYPTYGSYRRIGILENPEFDDVRVTLENFDRVNLSINNKTTASANVSITNWFPGEVVVQGSSNAAGVVVVGNSTFLQLRNVLGDFDESNSQIIGYYSNTTANVASVEIIRFQVTSDSPAEIISQVGSGAKGEVTSIISNTELILSNVVGKFVSGDTMFDASVNAFAVVNSISTANGSRDVTSSFGTKFIQTMRLTLTSNVGSFANGETVVQDLTNASAVIVTDKDEVDLAVTISNGAFTTGQLVTSQNTGATGYITSSNSTYFRLTGVSQNTSFATGDTINNELNSTATINNVSPVLLLNNVDGTNRFQAGSNNVVGQTTGATGLCNSFSLILYPELVRDSGKVLYIDNVQPITRSDITKEEVRLVIKF
jgi:hypothetical protein